MRWLSLSYDLQQSAKGAREIQGVWQQTDDLNINIEWILSVISMKITIAPLDY